MATLVIAHSHVHLHYNTQAEKLGMVARPQERQNVGMVKMYSKSVHVNDLGFASTNPPSCMDRSSSCFWRKHFYTPFALMVSSIQG